MHNIEVNKFSYKLSKYPEFGTYCKTDPDTFFFPFSPINKTQFTENFIVSDSLFLKKDTFYLIMNNPKKGKELFNFR